MNIFLNKLQKTPLATFCLKKFSGSSHCGAVEMNMTSIHEDVGSIPGLTQCAVV